jgi:hypothetical protein
LSAEWEYVNVVWRSVLETFLIALPVCVCCNAFCLAQTVNSAKPPLKSVQERTGRSGTPDTVETGGMTKRDKFARCMESWERATHMSKKQWQRACERSVKDYPETFR